MNLFQLGDFTLRSGRGSKFKIECDAWTDEDVECLAWMMWRLCAPFGSVEGVPRGGVRLADRMAKYGTSCIPVVNPSNRRQVVGVMSRDDVFRAREIWFEEERTLERSLSLSSLKPSTWLQRWASGRRDDDSGEDGAA